MGLYHQLLLGRLLWEICGIAPLEQSKLILFNICVNSNQIDI